jgi:hypothetical protein
MMGLVAGSARHQPHHPPFSTVIPIDPKIASLGFAVIGDRHLAFFTLIPKDPSRLDWLPIVSLGKILQLSRTFLL